MRKKRPIILALFLFVSHLHLPAGAGDPQEAPPLEPGASLEMIHLRPGYRIELVAAEPLVKDPVAFDWSPDGRLWVVEMADYPNGMDGEGKPGGRVRILEDSDGDGGYDRGTIFAEDLNFPTGLLVWRDGVLVTAAPQIVFLRDTDGDGRADERKVIIEGFSEGNQQLRVNGLRWGLDNWIHCASGAHHGGYGKGNAVSMGERKLVLGSRDFRFRPEPGGGVLDPQSGPSQFGRNRDDWGNWFGVQNSMPVWHYVLRDHHLRRNPHFLAPSPKHLVMNRYAPVFPAKAPQVRFHGFEQSGKFTSACSAMVYRDDLLFPRGDRRHVFTCEPFHNLVQHNVLEPDGVTFRAHRDPAEGEIDFVASRDRWFRPVMVRTGPDGALWIADMYRYMIEHPQWLPQKGKDALRPYYRSGDDRGRIYRVLPDGAAAREWAFDPAGDLVSLLESPNGWVRDAAQRWLVQGGDVSVGPGLRRLAGESALPLARVHALCTLEGLGELRASDLLFGDPHPGVRRISVRLAGSLPDVDIASLISLQDDPDEGVRLELANALGFFDSPAAARALARLSGSDDPWISAAAMTSLHAGNIGMVLRSAADDRSPGFARILRQAVALKRSEVVEESLLRYLDTAAPSDAFVTVAEWSEAGGLKSIEAMPEGPIRDTARRAGDIAFDRGKNTAERLAAIRLLHLFPDKPTRSLLGASEPIEIQRAGVIALTSGEAPNPGLLLADWASHGPALRAAIFNRLLTRPKWAGVLLDHVEKGVIPRGEVDAASRRRLDSLGKPIRERAGRLFTPSKARARVLAEFRPALDLEGDAGAGRKVFEQRCAVCHVFAGLGRELGPDLGAITNRTSEALFVSILDPNAAVEAKYGLYTATTASGQRHAGMVAEETGVQITLLGADGVKVDLLRNEVRQFGSAGISLMPEGLEAGMTHRDLADLIRFLQSAEK